MTTNKKGSSDSKRGFNRRSVVLGTGMAIVGVGGVGSVLAGDEQAESGGQSHTDGDGATVPQGVQHNEAVLWDHDMDLAFTNRMRLTADPADEGREDVVHVTSDGEESQDYAVAGIDLRAEDLTLGAVEDDGSITYNYYKGETATYRVPDEVFLILQRADGGIAVTYRKEDTDQFQTWETRDVSSEFEADGWRMIDVDADEIDVDDEQVRVTAETIGTNIMALREQEQYSDVVDQFGADAHLLAVAIGNGSVDGVVSDAYFHDLEVAGTSYTVPATLTMEPTFDSQQEGGDGRITVSLSFVDENQGVSVEDIDPESVRMTSYSPFAPPIPGSDVPGGVASADEVSASDDTLTADFAPAGETGSSSQGDRPSTVLVFGGFEEGPYRFVAVGDLEGV
ncbi:hypothetical protein ACFQGT_17780 [Natrialbaceae archaeon GCM10025810]|uniref:hypothetical protein n=1 Tax=Halovalidus salilacus TaxID=3075124 RepID=UPI0036060CB5